MGVLVQALRAGGCRALSDVSLRALAAARPPLEVLHVADLSDLSDAALALTLAAAAGTLREAHLPRTLAGECALAALAGGGAGGLRVLDLSGCPHLHDGLLLPVVLPHPTRRPPPPPHHALMLLSASLVLALLTVPVTAPFASPCSDAAGDEEARVSQLAATGGSLDALALSGSSGVTDETLRGLGEHAPGLRRLLVDRCTGLTDAGLTAALGELRALEELDASGNRALTDTTARALLRGRQPWLRALDLRGCPLSAALRDDLAKLVGDRRPREL